jgi:hypothetical protein
MNFKLNKTNTQTQFLIRLIKYNTLCLKNVISLVV